MTGSVKARELLAPRFFAFGFVYASAQTDYNGGLPAQLESVPFK